MIRLAQLLLVSGCAMAPHVADTGISGAVIASGGAELNPIGFPGVVVAKVVAEGVAESYRQSGDRFTCAKVATAARYGSWVGTGATLGGLVGGPFGLAAGALVAAVTSYEPAADSAIRTCYSGRIVATASEPTGWESR